MKTAYRDMIQGYMEYYTNVTGKSIDDFYNECISDNKSWLADHIVTTLKSKGVSFDDILEFKSYTQRVNLTSITDNNFVIPDIWANKSREVLQVLVGDKWGTANIWDCACGSETLLRGFDYPADRLFCSTLEERDIEHLQVANGVTKFQLDFLNGIDYDEYNEFFSNQLPANLVAKLKNDEPFIFYLNPPYTAEKGFTSDISKDMNNKGVKDTSDLYCQFYHRIMLIKDYYNLTNVWIGMYHPLSRKNYVYELPMKYHQGFCFDKTEFQVSQTTGASWYIGFYLWSSDEPEYESSHSFRQYINVNGVLVERKNVTFEQRRSSYKFWVEGALKAANFIELPSLNGTTIQPDVPLKVRDDALGFYNGGYVFTANTKSASFSSLPQVLSQPITPETYEKFLPLLVICMLRERTYLGGTLILPNIPKTGKGYDEWLADCTALMLFSTHSDFFAERGVQFGDKIIDISNKFFPLLKQSLIANIEDEVLLSDINKQTKDYNKFMVEKVQYYYPLMSATGKKFFDFCISYLVMSLKGEVRKNEGYKNGTNCWDAGLKQVRTLQSFWTADVDKCYIALQNDLSDYVMQGLYDFGIMLA